MKPKKVRNVRWEKTDAGLPWHFGAGVDDQRVINIGSSESSFDELAIDKWFHLERMDDRLWHLRVGTETFSVKVKGDGTASLVSVT